MRVVLPIPDRAKRFGYVFWTRQEEKEVENLLGELDEVEVYFNGELVGKRHIDWKYRRISIGRKFSETIPPSVNTFVLSFDPSRGLQIECQ